MKKLLSLPPNLVDCFHDIESVDRETWFCTSDPVGQKLGSGGGTTWLLQSCYRKENPEGGFFDWLAREKRILLHAGGQSRRLPGYAPSGKVLTPIPVFRWSCGQKLSQNLLSLQLPLYHKIMQKAPESLRTLIASGDVYIRNEKPLQDIPEADVVCYGLWVDPSLAKNHGVFLLDRKRDDRLDFMLQKPTVEELGRLAGTHLFLMDIGIWLLSDRAVELLVKRSTAPDGELGYYDLYADFGCALGEHPQIEDEELNGLSVAILPLPGGEFYHYGTNRELISSTMSVQNRVNDQRMIMHRRVKPHPAMFVQNADIRLALTSDNSELWVENSMIGEGWQLADHHIITGVPNNDWNLRLPAAICIDVVPIGEKNWIARPYGFNDLSKGAIDDDSTLFMGRPFMSWLHERNIESVLSKFQCTGDIQQTDLFPVCETVEELGLVLRWMISEPELVAGRKIWLEHERFSADRISAEANLRRLYRQRESFRTINWPILARNYEKSIFYQLDLNDAAVDFSRHRIALPEILDERAPLIDRIRNYMFRARVSQLNGTEDTSDEKQAFALLREGLIAPLLEKKQSPRKSVYTDQIVWGRSPVRIDLAGGWTDTPPYCLSRGGNVVNVAIELNGQPPLQVYVKPCREFQIVLRSIDLGALEIIRSYDELSRFTTIGSPFAIPKAALVLAGFSPEFSDTYHRSLEEQLQAFGSGIELTLLSAIPAGSGLGTSSILASTVLGAVSDFCGLAWDKNEICQRTLVLEQLLTTGGGWQDQYGGVLHGVKLLQTESGFDQSPLVRWLPDFLFTDPEYRKCHLLYYTGVTRTAKNILAEIVRGMFLNRAEHLSLLAEMKDHAIDLHEAILRGNFEEMGHLVARTWEQNKRLDRGTNPPLIDGLIDSVKEYLYGCKLPGAGGGGYLYMIAKDPDAAARVRMQLSQCPLNERSRFVEMTLSDTGLQISRS